MFFKLLRIFRAIQYSILLSCGHLKTRHTLNRGIFCFRARMVELLQASRCILVNGRAGTGEPPKNLRPQEWNVVNSQRSSERTGARDAPLH
jgi:hypothetical protein